MVRQHSETVDRMPDLLTWGRALLPWKTFNAP
jgi:hypothetical protein